MTSPGYFPAGVVIIVIGEGVVGFIWCAIVAIVYNPVPGTTRGIMMGLEVKC